MRLAVLFLGALLPSVACATASIGTLDETGVNMPNRDASTTEDDDAGAAGGSTATLTVSLLGTGTGTIVSSPAGISCTGTTCVGTFPAGTAVTLTAQGVGGASSFVSWGGACAGTIPCTLTLTASTQATATFGTLVGDWTGTYENKRSANGCMFDNKGNLKVTVAATDGGASLPTAATIDGLELRDGDCRRFPNTVGSTTSTDVELASGNLTGTWSFVVPGTGGQKLAFPFKATISGTTMIGTWTCTGCTGSFTLTHP